MLSGHSAAQYIKQLCKCTSGSGFIRLQMLNFERNLNLSRGPKTVLIRLARFLLEALSIMNGNKEEILSLSVKGMVSTRKL